MLECGHQRHTHMTPLRMDGWMMSEVFSHTTVCISPKFKVISSSFLGGNDLVRELKVIYLFKVIVQYKPFYHIMNTPWRK